MGRLISEKISFITVVKLVNLALCWFGEAFVTAERFLPKGVIIIGILVEEKL